MSTHRVGRTPLRVSRSLAAAGLALALCVCAPQRAAAESPEAVAIYTGIIAGSALGVGFVIADSISFAMRSPWDEGTAAFEIGAAGLFVVTWAALSIAALEAGLGNDAYGMWMMLLGYSIAPGLIGGYLLGHAIWSLMADDAPPPVSVALAPYHDGALAGIRGAF